MKMARRRKLRFSNGNEDKPAVFLAQFLGSEPPFDNLMKIARWFKDFGFGAVSIPVWDTRVIDLDKAADSKQWCDDNITGPLAEIGMKVSDLATHLFGQLMAQNPTQQPLFAGFGPKELASDPQAQYKWAQVQMKKAVNAAVNLDCKSIFSFTGNFLFPFVYPWPPRPFELVKVAFKEHGRRWKPVLDFADLQGLKIGMEVHPQEDVFDGDSFEQWLEAVGNNPAAGIAIDPSHLILQGIDYLKFIAIYAERIYCAHWKDAELHPTGRQGVYGGYRRFKNRVGRFRSLGDGDLDLPALEKAFAKAGLSLWRVLEWECVIKGKVQGAREGAKILHAVIDNRPIPKFRKVDPNTDNFESFASGGVSKTMLEKSLGFTIPAGDAMELKLAD